MKKALLLLIIILTILVFTNPSKSDFKNFVEKYVEEKLEEGNVIEQLIGGLFSGSISAMVEESTERKNFYVMSIYTVETGNKEYNYIGIATTFVPLQKENPLDDK